MCANKWLMLNCYCYIAILEIILFWAKKWLIVIRIIRIRLQYLKKVVAVCKKMSSGSFKNAQNKMCLQIKYSIYMYKEDLTLSDLQWLICLKTQPNQILYI